MSIAAPEIAAGGSARCYACGAAEIAADADIRSPTCEACKPVRDHVVSNQTGKLGGALAVCECGWWAEVLGPGRYRVRDDEVKLHWAEVVRQARAANLQPTLTKRVDP